MNFKDLGAIIALGLAILAGAAGYGSLKTESADTKTRQERIEPVVQQLAQDMAAIKQGQKDMQDSLDRVEGKLGTK